MAVLTSCSQFNSAWASLKTPYCPLSNYWHEVFNSRLFSRDAEELFIGVKLQGSLELGLKVCLKIWDFDENENSSRRGVSS